MNKWIILLFGVVTFGTLSSCGNKEVCKDDATVRITDDSYFSVARTLEDINDNPNCVDYIISATNIYGFHEVSAALTIAPGVVIEFEDDAGFNITNSGSIHSVGTASKPIVMKGANTANGSWKGVIIFSSKTANELNYTTIDGAGGDSFNSNDDKGNLVVYSGAKVAINNSTFSNSAAYGINSNYTDANITSLLSNTFTKNNAPILIRGNLADIVDASNIFSENINSYVHVINGNEITTTKTWQAISIPYRFAATSNGLFKHQEIGTNGQLIIEAGTTIQFESETGIKVDRTAAFTAIGTASKPIVLTGTSETTDFWDGILVEFTQNPLNEIAYTTFKYAGSGVGAITMWADPKLSVHDVSFENISSCAIYDSPKTATDPNNPNLTISNNTYTNVNSQYCKGN